MKNLKRIAVLVVALAMILNMVVVSAFDADNKFVPVFQVEKTSAKANTSVKIDLYFPAATYGMVAASLTFGEGVTLDETKENVFNASATEKGATASKTASGLLLDVDATAKGGVVVEDNVPFYSFYVNVGEGGEDKTLAYFGDPGDIGLMDETNTEISADTSIDVGSPATIDVTPVWNIAGQDAVEAAVELGTSLETAAAKLPGKIIVNDGGSYSGERNVTGWTSTTYNPNELGEYEFTGTLLDDPDAASQGAWTPVATVEVTEIAATIEVGVGGIVKYQAQTGLTAADLKDELETTFVLSEGTAFEETVTVEWTAIAEDPDPITGAKGDKVTFQGAVVGTPVNHEVTVNNAIVELDNLFADEEIVATIGADQYNSLQTAVDAYTGTDIKLYHSSNDTAGATIAKDVTIDLNGKTYAGAIEVTAGTLTLKGNGKIEGGVTGAVVAADGYKVVTKADATYVVTDTADSAVKLVFEKVSDGVFNIVLYPATDGGVIHEFVSAEFEFTNASKTVGETGNMLYSITAAEGMTAVRDLSEVNDKDAVALVQRWAFARKNLANHLANTDDESILLGTIAFDGYGQIELSVTDGVVHTTLEETNNEYHYYVAADMTAGVDGELVIADSKITGEDGKVDPLMRKVIINVEFPNDIDAAVAGANTAYNDMKVSVIGEYPDFVPVVDKDLEVKNNGLATAEIEVYAGYRYVFTLEGAGYRTARYTTIVDGKDTNGDTVVDANDDNQPNLDLYFWNNVKFDEDDMAADSITVSSDPAKEIEVGVSGLYTKNFLAGDIAMDNIIDKYDLAAVVSYFGTYDLVAEKPEYAKYDLNRDGKIDSEDIAYVLYSIGE